MVKIILESEKLMLELAQQNKVEKMLWLNTNIATSVNNQISRHNIVDIAYLSQLVFKIILNEILKSDFSVLYLTKLQGMLWGMAS